ncbi:DUF7666 domain-containing protein [Silvibacterium acidisoli]|uniref:DUF7666 domain-containing protein n=1 Tax=Acidobacteriaceae bacterium ZG23-2 TaxID=2883246 RepID=UPI00406D36B4
MAIKVSSQRAFSTGIAKKRTKKTAVKAAEVAPEMVLALRTCDKDMKAYGGFQWPKTGRVEAPDWKKTKECGHGLHGLLRGQGDGGLLSWEVDAVWMAVWVQADLVVELDGKVKFPWCEIALVGDRKTVTDFLVANGCTGVVGGTATAGHSGTATAGYKGTATAGHSGTATAGYKGTATAGDYGTATAGYKGTATAGDYGTATAGHSGTATAGYKGTATAGDYGTATAGYKGTATAGHSGTATAGDYGILNIRYWDGNRERIATFYVGEDGIEPNVPYRVDGVGAAVKAVK